MAILAQVRGNSDVHGNEKTLLNKNPKSSVFFIIVDNEEELQKFKRSLTVEEPIYVVGRNTLTAQQTIDAIRRAA